MEHIQTAVISTLLCFISKDIDLVDIRKAKATFAFHIIKNSMVIFDANEEIRTDFEDRLIMKYLDFSSFNKMMNEELASSLREESHD